MFGNPEKARQTHLQDQDDLQKFRLIDDEVGSETLRSSKTLATAGAECRKEERECFYLSCHCTAAAGLA